MRTLILLSSLIFWITGQSAMAQSLSNPKESTVSWLLSVYEPVEGGPVDGSGVTNDRRTFMNARLKNAKTSFEKWRGFPPAYYAVVNSMKDQLPLGFTLRYGLCGGDSHTENFGFIASDPPKFGINDLDDVAMGSLNLDLMRLFISARMVDRTLSAQRFLDAYRSGLSGTNMVDMPSSIKALQTESIAKGHKLSKKNAVVAETKTCSGEYIDVSDAEKLNIENSMKSGALAPECARVKPLNDAEASNASQIVDAVKTQNIVKICKRVKDSGGSAGANRYLVVVEKDGVKDDGKGNGKKGDAKKKINYEAFEIKQLNPVASRFQKTENSSRSAQYKVAVDKIFGEPAAEDYFPVEIGDGALYQRRPAWEGNKAVKIEDIRAKGVGEMTRVLMYEAQTLGQMHRKSNSSPLTISTQEWEQTANRIESAWRSKF